MTGGGTKETAKRSWPSLDNQVRRSRSGQQLVWVQTAPPSAHYASGAYRNDSHSLNVSLKTERLLITRSNNNTVSQRDGE